MRGEEGQSTGVLIGLAVSVVLHLALLWWVLQRPAPPPREAPETSRAIELVAVELADDAPPASPPATPPPAAARPQRENPRPLPPPRVEPPSRPAPVPTPESETGRPARAEAESRASDGPTGDPGDEASAAAPEAPTAASRNGAPLLAEPTAKVERPWFVPGGAGTHRPGQAVAGTTTRSGEPGAAQRELVAEGARVKERVDGILAETGGAYRVATGTMDPYFVELGRALNAELEKVPAALARPDVLRELHADYARKLARSGRTGAAWEDTPVGEGRDRDSLPMVGLQREAERHGGSLGGGGGPVLLGASAQRGKLPAILRAELSIRQAPDGSVIEVTLLRGSGNPVFDTFVVGVAPESVKRLAPPPARGSGIRASGLKSVWSFTGNLKLDKRLRDFKLPDDLPYLSALVVTGQLGGSLDFTNLKDTPVADMRDPKWDLKARLMRVE